MPGKSQKEELAIQAKKARIIDLFNADGDWRRLATQLNILKTTACGWIKEENKDYGRGGSYNVQITNEHRDTMCNFIENNPKITLAQIVAKL